MSGTTESGDIRLNLFLARIGIASRRACDEIIAAGRVRVDGRIVRELGTKVDPSRQEISVDGHRVAAPQRRVVLLLHKPRGVVCTVSDPEGRPTVLDICRPYARRARLFPVGRLDVNTTGALLLTNDGLLCYRLTHPRFGIPRIYQVRVRGAVDEARLRRLERMAGQEAHGHGRRAGVRPSVDVVARLQKETVLKVTLLEGRNRQVRNMCESVGLLVVALKRVSFGPVSVRGLPLGAVRPLERRELDRLDAVTGEDDR
jgi:pseudouridine synthase